MKRVPSSLRSSLALFQSQLFHDVQMSGLFTDSKTFADAEPKSNLQKIIDDYLDVKDEAGFRLGDFVADHFLLPQATEIIAPEHQASALMQVEMLWDLLKRPADMERSGSLLPLPNAYSVPGGRFREIYYWDSYFTALGLIDSGRLYDVESMLDNFISLQAQVGAIPNGNRSYYFSRSQPPVLALIAELIDKENTFEAAGLRRVTQALRAEYDFWMSGSETLCAKYTSHRRVVRLPDGALLNRYWDDEDGPRPESYKEDIDLAVHLAPNARPEFYRHIRAACESGWDFCSRWLREPGSLSSIQTTNIVPVDLNCLMYRLESTLGQFYGRLGDRQEANRFKLLADGRKRAIDRHFWCERQQFYFDLDLARQKHTGVWSLAGILPLFVSVASKQQAAACQQALESKFLQDGGLVTTTTSSPQQWDSPNGWAPLHWFAVSGLFNYGAKELAQTIMGRWLDTIEVFFQHNGKLMEKYDVLEPMSGARGGEYDVQEGFGWTNGVSKRFYRLLNQ